MQDDWKEKYRVCRVCDKPVEEEVAVYALRRLEKPSCSSECSNKEELQRFACCDKAEQHPCVCYYATTCPTHGTNHFGTHD